MLANRRVCLSQHAGRCRLKLPVLGAGSDRAYDCKCAACGLKDHLMLAVAMAGLG